MKYVELSVDEAVLAITAQMERKVHENYSADELLELARVPFDHIPVFISNGDIINVVVRMVDNGLIKRMVITRPCRTDGELVSVVYKYIGDR